ncbi:MAG: hypothetical protein H7A46_21360 [Verrucomicrobiales bacterium]|nr:hypothetical protein [Verrucomicrobiales bacterium]
MADTGTIAAPQLSRLSGLTERRLRALVSEGWLPSASKGHYPLVPAIQGLLRYYRERDQKRTVQDSYDSLASCANGTGIPMTALKHAKRSGCAAFRGSRVYLEPLLRWLFETPDRSPINYDQERAQHVVLQNAKLKVQLRQLKAELIPADEVAHLGRELGSAIRTVITRLHRLAPSLDGHGVPVIESRLKEVEDEVLGQLQVIDERLTQWQAPD